MYGGYGGYPYNQQWGYPVPVMPAPAVEENKQSPSTGLFLFFGIKNGDTVRRKKSYLKI